MGDLFVLHQSFELNQLDPSERDEVLIDYCNCIDLIYKQKDNLYASDEIDSHNFSYGDLYNGLIYRPWKDYKNDPNLFGISINTHNLFFSSLYQFPNLINDKLTYEDFIDVFNSGHYGFNGLNNNVLSEPYVFSKNSWQSWYNKWLSEHQNEIDTAEIENYFLPNIKYSNEILHAEIIKHKKESELKTKHRNDIGITFHYEIMKHFSKGEMISYAEKIGGNILRNNFYKFESALTTKESLAFGSLRRIYSLATDGIKKYISIDFEKGMFEYYNSKGKHLGEYRFDGGFNKKAEESHNLKTIQ